MFRLARASLVAFALASSACSSGAADDVGLRPLAIPDDADCDPLVPEICAMPFPSSKWLAPDAARKTGYALKFGAKTLPANKSGVHVDPAPYRRLDGFGVGVPAMAFFADLDATNLPDETRIPETMTANAKVMMFEVAGGVAKRIPCFAELDQGAKTDDQRSLLIRPAVLLREGTRYIVALRGLVRKDGTAVPSSDAFIALRDGRAKGTPVEERAARFDEMFALLAGAGVAKKDLTLAWDWVTASGDALHGPLLHMRDQAFAALGGASPAFAIQSIDSYDPATNPDIAYEVHGTFDVPDYMIPAKVGAKTGHVLNWGPDRLPAPTGAVYHADFRARVPRSALGGKPAGVMIYGHGLNGTDKQISASYFDALANQENVIIAGCNMIGMSAEDVNVTLEMLADLSGFPALADRLHQGVLDYAFLARAMKLGFGKLPAIAATGVVVDPSSLWYAGISQGGIFGATHVAMSLDITRGHFGVPGNDYATLLQRSQDFSGFFLVVGIAYPDARDQQVLLGTIQNLWDRTDPVSHYRHVSAEPFPGTPSHAVLLAPARGDWQVAPLTDEIVARSDVGVALMAGYGRDVALVTPAPYPRQGSGIVSYSFGNPWPAPGNHPPSDAIGDPHGKPRELAWHNQQMFHFFRTGEIVDVCGGDGCTPH